MTMPRAYHRDYSRNYYHERKTEYLNLLGGVCVHCGGIEGLQFDHIDPDTKKFPIGKILNYSKEKALAELNKCQILCFDCHVEKTKINKDVYSKRLRGELVKGAVLTEALVKRILTDWKDIPNTKLAKELAVNRSTISLVKRRLIWKHVIV